MAELESSSDIGTILVIDPEARLVGLITEQDLCRVLAKPVAEVSRVTAHDVMKRDYVSCAPENHASNVRAPM